MSLEHSTARGGRDAWSSHRDGPYGRLLTRDEVCRRLGRSPASLYRDIAAGLLPAPLKLGRSSRWTEADIDAVIARALQRRDGEEQA